MPRQPQPLYDEFWVNTTTTDDQQYSAVATLNNGDFVVVWESDGQDGDGYGIYGQAFDGDGFLLDEPFRLNTYRVDDQYGAAIAALSGGGFVVVWSSQGQDGDGYGVYGQRYGNDGVKRGGEFRVNTTTLYDQYAETVTPLTNGDFLVTWEHAGLEGYGTEVYGQQFNSNGTRQGEEFRVHTTTANDQFFSAAAPLTDGFVVTWTSRGQDGDGYGIYGQRFDNDGYALGSEFRVNSYTTHDQSGNFVAPLDNGGFVVTWSTEDRDGDGFGIYGQRYDSDGARLGSEFRVNTYTGGDQVGSAAAQTSGGFVVVWTSYDDDQAFGDLYGQHYDNNGTKRGGEFPVNTTAADEQFYASAAPLGEGTFLATWTSDNQDGDGYGIYGQIFYHDITLSGTSGIDTLTGGPGADTLNGGAGADDMAGGEGNDVYVVDNSGDLVFEWAGQGTDLVKSSVSWILDTALRNLTLTGTAAINGTGNGLANVLTGNRGVNTLSGGGGKDSLCGGAGADRLTGGAGADLFRFTATSDGRDILTDFNAGQGDKLNFVSANFGELPTGALGSSRFVANASGTLTASGQRFVFNTTTRVLSYDADGRGGGAAVALALLNTGSLSATSLVITAS